uniref:Somatostatin/Cortistatin C-terminal domain-containing protein n=1 Tax=Sinocyclocheilus rhinocerous TaxID=307959 RepID=A0A673HFK9_9TELE
MKGICCKVLLKFELECFLFDSKRFLNHLLFSLQLQDLSRLLLLKQLSESVAPEEKDALESIDDLEVRNEVVRQIPFSQRERKAGCRNFYWKTFTSC